MNENYVKVVNKIYKEMENNIDIIKYWFEIDNKKLDKQRLFKYEKFDFSQVLDTQADIYVFVNKMINNILYGKSFQVKNLNYLELNFVSLANIVIADYNNSYLKGEDVDECN